MKLKTGLKPDKTWDRLKKSADKEMRKRRPTKSDFKRFFGGGKI
jgi:hypothetical protein